MDAEMSKQSESRTNVPRSPVSSSQPRLPASGPYEDKSKKVAHSHSVRVGNMSNRYHRGRTQENGDNDEDQLRQQNRSISLPGATGTLLAGRRASIVSTSSRSSKYSFSSIRSRLTRTFSHDAPSVVDGDGGGSGRHGQHTMAVLKRKPSQKQMELMLKQKELEEDQRKVREAETMAALTETEKDVRRETLRAAKAEDELKNTAGALSDLKARLQEIEDQLERERLGRREAELKMEEVERNIIDEKAAAQKVYKMYVDLAYEVASAKLDVSVPNLA